MSAGLASLAWPMPVYWPVDSARIVTAGKMLFPTAVFESGPVWTKYFLRLSFPPFFKHVFDAALSIVGVGILQTILRKKQRNGHLEAQDRLADLKLNETIQRGILHLEHLQCQYPGVRQIFRSGIVDCNCLYDN